MVVKPHWLFAIEAEHAQMRIRVEQVAAELIHAQGDATTSHERKGLLAMQLNALELYANVLGHRIAEATRNLEVLP